MVLFTTMLTNIFIQMVCDKYVVFIYLYVNYMLAVSNDMKSVTKSKRFLSSTFKMKDHEQVDTILGIKIKNCAGYMLKNCLKTWIYVWGT